MQWQAHKSRIINEATNVIWLMPVYNNIILFYKNKKILRVFNLQDMARNNRLVEEFQNELSIDTITIEGLKKQLYFRRQNFVFH